MKTINSIILSLLLASSTEAVQIREAQVMSERTIAEALIEVKTHKKKHHHHQSDSDEESDESDKKPLTERQSLIQQTIDAVEQSKGSPQEDEKMRQFIKQMKDKKDVDGTPTTLEFRVKQGIKERANLHPDEVKHVEAQAEAEAKATAGGAITQEQIKPVGGKDQLPDYENKNNKTLKDAHDNHLDMHGNEPKMPYSLSKDPLKNDGAESKQEEKKPPSISKDKHINDGAQTKTEETKPATSAPASAKPAEALVQKSEKPKPAAAATQTPATQTAAPAKPVVQKADLPKSEVKTGLSEMEKNFEQTLQEVLALHESSVDLLTADSAFHKLSHLSDPEKDYRTLDKTMTEMAYLDVLDKFDVSMSDEEEKSFYRNHFEPAWKKFSDGTTLDYVRTPGFFQELIKRIN